MKIERVLVVDDEPLTREFFAETLARIGCEADQAADGDEARTRLNEGRSYDLVLTDIKMGEVSGLDVLAHVKQVSPQTLVALITAHATLESALEAMHGGAFEYLTKPITPRQIEVLVAKAGEYRGLLEENRFYRQEAAWPEQASGDLVGRGEAMKEVLRLVDRVAGSSATVLITGESGTGKELIARGIHQRSGRASKPFIRVNCAALPETLLESELFGHEKGAFTGAIERRPGRFELADTGTLLLDEISETSTVLQSKLLRVLQEREFERVGGTKTLKVDVRVICTTNRELKKLVAENKFREDLFYRLNVVPIALPPLRERGGDVVVLAEYFLRRYAERHHRPLPALTPEARAALCAYSWPGNVRELENAMERAILFCESGALGPEGLGLTTGGEAVRPRPAAPEPLPGAAPWDAHPSDAVCSLAEVEQRVILRTLEQMHGNRTRAAKLLGISVRTLYTKLREYQAAQAKPGATEAAERQKVAVA
jgi:DNA-binding NtrC family response regulator